MSLLVELLPLATTPFLLSEFGVVLSDKSESVESIGDAFSRSFVRLVPSRRPPTPDASGVATPRATNPSVRRTRNVILLLLTEWDFAIALKVVFVVVVVFTNATDALVLEDDPIIIIVGET